MTLTPKDATNIAKHPISLPHWIDLDIKVTFVDDRYDYGEIRYRAYGYIDGMSYCLTLTDRHSRVRPISLRRAHAKEMKRYVS